MAVWDNPKFKDRINLLRTSLILFTLYILFIGATKLVGEFLAFFLIAIVSYTLGHITASRSFRKKINNFSKKKWVLNKGRLLVAQIPTVIWGAFAVLGIFIIGILVGTATPAQSSQGPQESKKELEYRQVIDGYQNVSKLFYLQQQDMDIVTNTSSWQEHPEEVIDAISSYHQKKDEILFQWGRIYELRKKAGLSDDIYFKTE